jgi:ADP-ribose pyrophosphatase
VSELEVLARRTVYEGSPILKLELHDVRLANGVERRFEVIHHPGAAAVVPIHENGDVVLLHQLRYAADRATLWEIPAGKLEPGGEAPETCARRELEEETGLVAGRLELLVPIWVTPGFCDERIWIYLARDLAKGKLGHEDDEVIDIHRLPFARALEMIARGEITDAKTIAGLACAALRLGKLPT